jgi:tRNA A37 threonylcarbamoyladenosine biosynthesis protein TsaE
MADTFVKHGFELLQSEMLVIEWPETRQDELPQEDLKGSP